MDLWFDSDAARNGAAGGSATSRAGKDSLTRKTGMSLEEAYQILNLKKDKDVSNVSKVFNQFAIYNKTKSDFFFSII